MKKKLSLHKETLANLAAEQLEVAQAGLQRITHQQSCRPKICV